MIRISLLTTALVMWAQPALAQDSGEALPDPISIAEFPVTGEVPDLCILGDPRIDGGAASINVESVSGRIVRITSLSDPATLSTRGTQANILFDAMCNYPYRVSVESRNNGLWRQTTDTPTPVGFANAVPYYATVSWNEESAELDADAKSRSPKTASFSSLAANAGELGLQLRILPGTTNAVAAAPLVAGDYGDILTITLGPQ